MSIREVLSSFIREYIRPHSPFICRRYTGGVKVRDYRLIDLFLGGGEFFKNDYKPNLVDAVREAVSHGDDVVVIGGGFGISSVNAYKESITGNIIVYECSEERIEECRNVFAENNAEIDLREKAVGVVKKEIGSIEGADVINPDELPECDVLEMDCEGAEVEILEGRDIRPDSIVVETHEEYNASTEKVKRLLKELGYRVVSERPDAEFTDDNVLVAKYIGVER